MESQYKKGLKRRPDSIVFINGLPIIVGKLKSSQKVKVLSMHTKTMKGRKRTYPNFTFALGFSPRDDDYTAKVGSPTSGLERFFHWEGIENSETRSTKESS